PQRRQRDVQTSLDKVKRREHRKGDAAHAPDQRLVAEKYAGKNKTKKIRWQHRLAFACCSQAAEKEKNEKDEFDLGFTHLRCAEARDNRLCPARHEPEDDQRHDHKQQEPDIIVRKQHAQREHRPEISNETRSKNHFAHGSIAESALDHDGVNDRDRCEVEICCCTMRVLPRDSSTLFGMTTLRRRHILKRSPRYSWRLMGSLIRKSFVPSLSTRPS